MTCSESHDRRKQPCNKHQKNSSQRDMSTDSAVAWRQSRWPDGPNHDEGVMEVGEDVEVALERREIGSRRRLR